VEPGRVPLNKGATRQMLSSNQRSGKLGRTSSLRKKIRKSSQSGTASDQHSIQQGDARGCRQAIAAACHERAAALVPVVAVLHPHHENALVEYAARLRARLHDVIDYHLTTRHDQLEPTLRISENANILQRVPIDHEQIGRGSGSHHAYHALHPQ
jgi:hypothetical protein